jgi:hypothetical protein
MAAEILQTLDSNRPSAAMPRRASGTEPSVDEIQALARFSSGRTVRLIRNRRGIAQTKNLSEF